MTPSDYEPPGFRASAHKEFSYDGNKVKIELGRLNSHWHQLKFDLNVSDLMIKDVDDYDGIDSISINNTKVTHDQLNASVTKYEMKELKEALDDKKKPNEVIDEEQDDDFDKKKLKGKFNT